MSHTINKNTNRTLHVSFGYYIIQRKNNLNAFELLYSGNNKKKPTTKS